MKFQAGGACLLVLLCCLSMLQAEETTPQPKPCPSVPSNRNFHEREIAHFWRATHYAESGDIGFNWTNCLTVNIHKNPVGVSLVSKLDVLGTKYNETTLQNRTDTPGIYTGGNPYGTTVFYLHHGYLLVQVCIDDKDMHHVYSVILSRRHTTPKEVRGHFKHFLENHGVHVGHFSQFHHENCH